MSDAEMLLLIVGAIYLSECARWVRLDTVLFCPRWLRGWQPRHPGGFVRNERGALTLGNLLPPLQPNFVAQWWPLSLSPDAVLGFVHQAVNPSDQPDYTQKLVAYDDIREIRTYESELRINGNLFAKLCSPQLATKFARLIRKLGSAPQESRAELIDRALKQSLCTRRAQRRLWQASRRAAKLRRLCNILFGVLVIATGLLVWWAPTRWLWPYFLFSALLLWTCTVREFRKTFRRLHARHASQWRSHGLMMFLSPLAALRGYDFAMRDALSLFHPLAVAKTLCSEDLFRQLAHQTYCDLKFPNQRDKTAWTAQQSKTLEWFHEQLEVAIEKWLFENGVDVAELLAPPASEGDDAVSYCPRCLSQYVMATESCLHCGGIELRQLEPGDC